MRVLTLNEVDQVAGGAPSLGNMLTGLAGAITLTFAAAPAAFAAGVCVVGAAISNTLSGGGGAPVTLSSDIEEPRVTAMGDSY